MKLDLTIVLGWGSLDVKKLEEYLTTLETYNKDTDDVLDFIESMDMSNLDINSWYYATMNLIIDGLCKELREIEDIENYVDDFEDEVRNSIYIDYMCSDFDHWISECDLSDYIEIADELRHRATIEGEY